jgi:hypothetical protein
MDEGIVWRAPYGRIIASLLVGVVAFRIGAAFYTAGDTALTVWGDRDLWRALTIRSSWPAAGPEINGGLRPPGGAFYLLLGAILAIQPSVLAANVGLLALFAASLLLLGIFLAREVNPQAGAFAAAALAGSPTLNQILEVWNPGFLLLFATTATLFGYRYLKTGRASALGIAAAATAVGLQIHLQIFQLAIALAAGSLIRHPRWTWRHSLALVLGLGLPYLPLAIGGDYPLLASAVPVPAGAFENYVLWGFDPQEKIRLIYGLLGGTPETGGPAAGGPFNGLAALSMAGDLLAALLALGFLGWAISSSRQDFMVDSTGRPIGFFALVTLVFFLVGLASTVSARHMVAAWPAVAAMTGLAADAVLRRLAAGRTLGLSLAGCAVLVCGLAVRPVALGEALLRADDASPGLAAAQADIAATAKSAFYADHDAFEAHAALFWRAPSRSWQLVQEGVTGQMAFIYRTAPVSPVKHDREECLAILGKDEISGDTPAELARSPAFAGLAPVFGPMAAESAHFAYFPYTTADGNCLKSFPNAYIPTAFETAFLQPGGERQAFASTDAARFVAVLPGQAFPIGLELRRSGTDYVAVLHGRPLRGYTGLRFATIINPALCLADNVANQVVPLGRITVGSPQRGTLAPWRSPRFALADGTYRLWLTGQDGKSPQALRIPLGLVVLPDMRVGPPAAGDATPPVGCPVPAPALPAGIGR